MYYAICDKYGVVKLNTINDDDIVTSTSKLIFATKEQAKSKCKILNEFYGYAVNSKSAFSVQVINEL